MYNYKISRKSDNLRFNFFSVESACSAHDLRHSFSFEWVFRSQPITDVQNREPTSVFIMHGDGVLKNRSEIECIFTQKHKTTEILTIGT